MIKPKFSMSIDTEPKVLILKKGFQLLKALIT
jgi:hypothetical protein